MNWFFECRTYEQGKRIYNKLAKEHHPDRGGDVRIMQEINSQWARFKKANRPSPGARPEPPPPSTGTSGRPNTSQGEGTAPRPNRQRYRASKSVKVQMPQTHRRGFTRTVELKPSYYVCHTCGRQLPLDWYPGSWKPLYCPDHRAEAARRANRERQQRYRDARKK